MCPNHVEPILEQKLLKSVGLSERIKLWENYSSENVHGETIKLNFLKKASRRSAPYRLKVPERPRNLVKVPESVKRMYRKPVDLIPNNNVLSADNKVLDNNVNNCSLETDLNQSNDKEKEEWLSGLIEFQSEVLNYLHNKKDNSPVKNEDQLNEQQMQDHMNKFLDLDQDQIKLLAWEKYKEKLRLENNELVNKRLEIKNQINQSNNLTKDDASLDTISLPEEDSLNICKSNLSKCFKTFNSPNNSFIDHLLSSSLVKIRAHLCPIIVENHLMKGNSVPMRTNCLKIGLGSLMDLNLLNYGFCNYVSDTHALIFYDEVNILHSSKICKKNLKINLISV